MPRHSYRFAFASLVAGALAGPAAAHGRAPTGAHVGPAAAPPVSLAMPATAAEPVTPFGEETSVTLPGNNGTRCFNAFNGIEVNTIATQLTISATPDSYIAPVAPGQPLDMLLGLRVALRVELPADTDLTLVCSGDLPGVLKALGLGNLDEALEALFPRIPLGATGLAVQLQPVLAWELGFSGTKVAEPIAFEIVSEMGARVQNGQPSFFVRDNTSSSGGFPPALSAGERLGVGIELDIGGGVRISDAAGIVGPYLNLVTEVTYGAEANFATCSWESKGQINGEVNVGVSVAFPAVEAGINWDFDISPSYELPRAEGTLPLCTPQDPPPPADPLDDPPGPLPPGLPPGPGDPGHGDPNYTPPPPSGACTPPDAFPSGYNPNTDYYEPSTCQFERCPTGAVRNPSGVTACVCDRSQGYKIVTGTNTCAYQGCGSPSEDNSVGECFCPIGPYTGTPGYGSSRYTTDTPICWAAKHVGAMGDDGGWVNYTYGGSYECFDGTTRNGVKTADWSAGTYPSYYVGGASGGPPPKKLQQRIVGCVEGKVHSATDWSCHNASSGWCVDGPVSHGFEGECYGVTDANGVFQCTSGGWNSGWDRGPAQVTVEDCAPVCDVSAE